MYEIESIFFNHAINKLVVFDGNFLVFIIPKVRKFG